MANRVRGSRHGLEAQVRPALLRTRQGHRVWLITVDLDLW